MAASLEVELKLRAEDDEPLRRLATVEGLGPYRLGPPAEVAELDRYLDTADGRLAAARWACRLRTRNGTIRVSLKGPAEHDAGDMVHRRPELEGPANDSLDVTSWPPSAALERLQALAAGQPLVERLALRQERIERLVSNDAETVGTLSLDRVTVLRAGRMHGGFLVIELELRHDAPDESVLDALLQELRAVDGLLPEPRSKLERALDLLPAVP
jgi:inorganic triphosphatase YgiF